MDGGADVLSSAAKCYALSLSFGPALEQNQFEASVPDQKFARHYNTRVIARSASDEAISTKVYNRPGIASLRSR